LIVDASVAAKWVLPEAGTERAILLRQQARPFIAPTLVIAEVGNAIWKRAMRDEISPSDAFAALRAAINLFAELVELSELDRRAMRLSFDLRHPIYDCFYIALALGRKVELVTADARMFAAATQADARVVML
jgi:predicted nucleic acid-binding protein